MTSAADTLSLVASGVSMSPPGASSIHGWSSSWPMWMTLCSFVRHIWPWPVKSMNTPSTAKTLSSSVHEVHSDSGSGFPPGIGGYFLYTGTILRPSMPPFLLMSSTNTLLIASVSPNV